MGLFTNKNHEKRIEALERSVDNISKNYDNISASIENDAGNGNKMDDDKKLQAAYALNLCTVSVSQIVDYNDLYIMDQEYEMILNNLNLENMPKDEALLNIFKQILDTITFFKIQDGDKKRLEEKYKQKQKNAIWSAVPNFSVVMTGSGGNPYAAAAIAAVQIGFAYMNYRKAKAEIDVERKDDEWKLQRTAIEQLNGLRRELFDTSWRISDNYNFPDEWRLTERQITQYNEILFDTNSARRFDRLEHIKESFRAYPPFWYYLANSAFEAARDYYNIDSIRNEYFGKAKEYYQEYLNISEKALLREDNIASACCLEYSRILLSEQNHDDAKIKELIDRALKNAGKSNDVIQTCAISYLGLGADEEAQKALLYLFNEGYNRITNAQVLSNLLVKDFIVYFGQQKSKQAFSRYRILQDRINESYLCPMPLESVIQTLETTDADGRKNILLKLQGEYTNMQKYVLAKKYALVLENYINKYAERFNKCIPLPEKKKDYPAYIYLDTDEARQERYVAIQNESTNRNKWERYISTLEGSEVYLEYVDILNDMIMGIFKLDFEEIEKEELTSSLIESAKEKQQIIEDNCKSLTERNKYDLSKFMDLFNMSLLDLSKPFWVKVFSYINTSILNAQTMSILSDMEYRLMDLCAQEELPTPEYVFENGRTKQEYSYKTIINPGIWGEEIKKSNERKEKIKNCREIIDKYKEKIIIRKTDKKGEDVTKIEIKTSKPAINGYLGSKDSKRLQKYDIKNSDVIAVIDDSSLGNKDLVFTTEAVYAFKVASVEMCGYDEISPGEDKASIKFNSYKYKNDALNIDETLELIEELRKEIMTADLPEENYGTRRIDKSFAIEVVQNGKICFK